MGVEREFPLGPECSGRLPFLALWAMSGVLVSSFSIRYSLFPKKQIFPRFDII